MNEIEKIRQEIERLKKLLEESTYYLDNSQQALGYSFALDDFNEFLDTLSEEPDKSLEEEYKDYVENDPVYSKLVNRIAGLSVARHFAQWGAEHTPLPEDTVIFNKGIEEGKRLMMEEAVEGRIHTIGVHNAIYIKEPEWSEKLDKYEEGDKFLVSLLPMEDEK